MIKKNGGVFGRNPTFKDVVVEGTLSIPAGPVNSGAALIADIDPTLAANSDSKVATQKAVKSYVDASVVGLLDLKGGLACAGNPNYPAALKGDTYMVTSAGKVGGASGTSVDVGDAVIASADNAGGTQAAVGASWFVLERNLTGVMLTTNNLSDVQDVATARSNLGLGSMATQSAVNVAITGGSIAGITDLAIADGGTGASTQQAALNAIAGAVTAARFLRGDGTNVSMSAIQAADVPTLNQSTSGSSGSVKSNVTTGLLQVAGPGAGVTRVMSVPDANFTAARTDAAQTFSGSQTFTNNVGADTFTFGSSYGQLTWDTGKAIIQGLAANDVVVRTRASGIDRLTIGANDVTVNTGNLVIGTSGKGIDFSVTSQAAGMISELLSDYEEGTFSAKLYFGGVEILAYNANGGWYSKIGNTVHFTIFIQVQQKGTPTGAVTVGNLPFTALNANSRKYSINVTGQSLAGLTGGLFGVMDENTTSVAVYQSDASGGVALTDAAFNTYSGDNLIVTGSYQTA